MELGGVLVPTYRNRVVIFTKSTMQGRMVVLSGGVSGVKSHGGDGVGVDGGGGAAGGQERVADRCTGGVGVAQESGMEQNSGLRAWVLGFTLRWAPTRFTDDEILDPVLYLSYYKC